MGCVAARDGLEYTRSHTTTPTQRNVGLFLVLSVKRTILQYPKQALVEKNEGICGRRVHIRFWATGLE